jgi:TonB family protein
VNRFVFAATAVLLAAASSSSAQVPQEFYPERALRSNVEGRVTVQCNVTIDGHMKDCTILSEAPDGYGFGAATVRLFETMVTVKPKPEFAAAGGGILKRTVIWRLPPGQAPANPPPTAP